MYSYTGKSSDNALNFLKNEVSIKKVYNYIITHNDRRITKVLTY